MSRTFLLDPPSPLTPPFASRWRMRDSDSRWQKKGSVPHFDLPLTVTKNMLVCKRQARQESFIKSQGQYASRLFNKKVVHIAHISIRCLIFGRQVHWIGARFLWNRSSEKLQSDRRSRPRNSALHNSRSSSNVIISRIWQKGGKKNRKEGNPPRNIRFAFFPPTHRDFAKVPFKKEEEEKKSLEIGERAEERSDSTRERIKLEKSFFFPPIHDCGFWEMSRNRGIIFDTGAEGGEEEGGGAPAPPKYAARYSERKMTARISPLFSCPYYTFLVRIS